MKKFIEFAMKKVKTFGVFDFVSFKLALISLGILLGAYFSRFFLNYAAIIWVIFVLSFVWMIYKVFVKKD